MIADFQVRVRPSPETNDHEVCLFSGDESLVDYFCSEMMGMDPDELLIEPCPLGALSAPHIAVIGRCNCGVTGCGSVAVEICREGNLVTWKSSDSHLLVSFIAEQYDTEIERALRDFSWETPDRTAARLIAKAIDRDILRSRGLEFEFASGRCREGRMTVALRGRPGTGQVLVDLPWDGKSAEGIANEFRLLLITAPESWPKFEWPRHHQIPVGEDG